MRSPSTTAEPEHSAEFAKYYGGEWTAAQSEQVEQHREMMCQIAWKPYMHSLTLPCLLQSIRTPTLIVWGRKDTITPLDCGERYRRGIPSARLVTIEDCGHMPEMETPEEFATLVQEFISI